MSVKSQSYPARRSAPSRRHGFGLVEVLVSMLILAIGLLGLASLQARSLKFNHDAFVRSQATALAYDLIDRIRINRTVALTYDQNPQDPGLACAPQQASVAMDLSCWFDAIQTALPGGTGEIAPNAGNPAMLDISLWWLDRERSPEDQPDCESVPGRQWVGGQCMVTQTWTFLP